MAKKRTIGILITGPVNTALVGRFGEYDDLFRSMLGEEAFSFSSYWVVDMEFPKSVNDCDAWLVTGSLHGTYEEHDFIPPLEKFIRDCRDQQRPMVGICFGHQIMAQALGGRVEKFDGGWGLGTQTYNVTLGEDDTTEQKTLFAVHQDQVVEQPRESKIIAKSEFCSVAGLSYGNEKSNWGLSFQPHPEFSSDWVEALIEARRGDAFTPDIADRGLASLKEPDDSADIGAAIRNFLLQ